MRTLDILGQKAVIGLEWDPLSVADDLKKEAAKAASDAKAGFGVVVTTGEEAVVGLAVESAAKGHPSAAAWLAQACMADASLSTGLIYVEPLSSQDAWLCVIRRGVPTPGFDVVVKLSALEEQIASVQAIGTLPVFSRDDSVVESQARSFEEIVEGLEPALIERIGGVAPKTLLLAVGLAAVAALAYGGFAYYQAHSERALQAKRLQTAALTAAQTEAERARLEKLLLERVQAELGSKVLALPSPKEQVSAWLSAIEDIPTYAAGWKLLLAECTGVGCTTTWERSKVGTVNTFLEAARASQWAIGTVEENRVTVIFPVPAAANRSGTLDVIPESAPGLWNLVTGLQKVQLAGLSYQTTPAEPIKVSLSEAADPAQPQPPVVPGSPAAEISARPIPWKLGKFEATGTRLFELRDFPEYVNFDYASVNKLELSFEQTTWKLTGAYTVR